MLQRIFIKSIWWRNNNDKYNREKNKASIEKSISFYGNLVSSAITPFLLRLIEQIHEFHDFGYVRYHNLWTKTINSLESGNLIPFSKQSSFRDPFGVNSLMDGRYWRTSRCWRTVEEHAVLLDAEGLYIFAVGPQGHWMLLYVTGFLQFNWSILIWRYNTRIVRVDIKTALHIIFFIFFLYCNLTI